MPNEPNSDLKIGFESVLRAGREILSIYRTDFKVRMKEKDDPVTEADMQAHHVVSQLLKDQLAGDVLLSEEKIPDLETRLKTSRVWILDPLDGTRDFVSRNPEFAVCLGLSIDGIAKLGFVYNPVTFELFWGAEGIGYGSITLSEELIEDILSSMDQFKIHEKIEHYLLKSRVQNESSLDSHKLRISRNQKLVVLVSRNEMKSELYDEYIENEKFNSQFEIISKGSIAYKLGLLSRGDADLILSLKPKNEWDICGGIAILNAMGFLSFEISTEKKYQFNQKDTRTFGLIAGNKKLVEDFWKENKINLQNSLRHWDGSQI